VTSSTPTATPSSSPHETPVPDLVNVSVLVEIEKTPIVGLEVHFEGESSTMATPPARTDEAGVASQLVNRSDMITISSGLGAVQFQPISAPATILHTLGVVEAEASRLVEPVHICRFLDSSNQDSLAFYANNSASEPLTIPRQTPLNSLHAADGTLVEPQPPETFRPGLNLFTAPTRKFSSTKETESCASGIWKLLGAEKRFGCSGSQAALDIPLCEARSELPCVEIRDEKLDGMTRAFRAGRRAIGALEQYLKAAYPDANQNFSSIRHLRRGAARIKLLVEQVKGHIGSCSALNPQCYEVDFPKEAMTKAFRKSFGSRPTKGRKYFRAVRDHSLRKFRRILDTFPDKVVKCE
jgi:hypothetical protein